MGAIKWCGKSNISCGGQSRSVTHSQDKARGTSRSFEGFNKNRWKFAVGATTNKIEKEKLT